MISQGSLAGALTAAALASLVACAGTRTVPGDRRAEPRTAPAGEPEASAEPAGSGASEASEDRGDDVSGDAAAPALVHLALELEDLVAAGDPDAPQTRITLVLTDRTGSSERIGLGVFDGSCQRGSGDLRESGLPDRTPILAADCWHAGSGSRLRVVRDGGEIVVLRAWIDESTETPSYDELQRTELPEGARVLTGEMPR